MIAEPKTHLTSRRPIWKILLVLLALAHVPFVGRYYLGLWLRPEYQFFPFALVAFVWLLRTRGKASGPSWTVASRLLLSLDVLCVTAAFALNSPWLAAVGMVLLCLAWCLNCADAGYLRSTGYLILLPLTTLRPPLNMDQNVIHWLQRVTTSVASQTFHQLGLLHVREGNVLRFPGKSFLVAEACSGVQSLFTILFLAALVISLRRRSVVHGIVLLSCGMAFAAGMNITRILAIAFAWQHLQIDLSVGVSHELVGYFFLAITAGLLLSADAFLDSLLLRIPYTTDHGPFGHLWNPLINVWNQLFINATAVHPAEARGTKVESERSWPRIRDLRKPRYWLHCVAELSENWFRSRSRRQLVSGLPFSAAAMLGVLLAFWLSTTSDLSVVKGYRDGLEKALQNHDELCEEFCLRALSSLRPHEPDIKFKLGRFLVAHDQVPDGVAMIASLIPEQTNGYAPARFWMVNQALQPKPMLLLDSETIEKHLAVLLRQQPENPDVHKLLSQIYAERKEWPLAERYLSTAARFKPELNLPLARLKRTLNRGPDAVRACGERAVEALSAKLARDRSNTETRIALSEAYLVSGNVTVARETLVAGLRQSENPLLKKGLANFDLMQVSSRLTESPMNREACVPVTMNALTLDPSSVTGLKLVEKLHQMGASIPPEQLIPVVAHWESALAESPENEPNRIMLGEALRLAGNASRASEVLASVVAAHPELRVNLGRLQIQSDRQDEATALLESVIAESMVRLQTEPKNVTAAATLAEALLVLGRSEEARTFLTTQTDNSGSVRIPSDAGLAAFYGRACLAEYDRVTGYRPPDSENLIGTEAEIDGTADGTLILELLGDAMKCRETIVPAIDRLALLSFSGHAAAKDAERMIRALKRDGQFGVEVLNRLGMYALILHKYELARDYLEQANTLSRSQNPMIMNNLAHAMIQSGRSDGKQALTLVNEALEKIPGNSDVLATRGEVYLAMKEWNLAIADLTEAMKDHPSDAELHRLLQRAYAGIPDDAMAAEHAGKASELETKLRSR